MLIPFPCDEKKNCAGSDDPIANLTSEPPDQRLFFSTVYGNHWRGTCCNFVCTSFESQADADNCAAATALIASEGGCGVVVHSDGSISCSDPSFVQDTDPTDGNPPGPPSNPNCPDCVPAIRLEQSDPNQPGTRRCTGGWIYEFLNSNMDFFGRSTAEANRIAQSFAQRGADLTKFCCTPTTMIFCVDEEGSYQQTIFGGTGPFTWITDTLPAGLTLEAVTPDFRTVEITGTPTVAGVYTINVQVNNINGNMVTGALVIGVIRFDTTPTPLPEPTVGVFYTAQIELIGLPPGMNVEFEIADGDLPDGLVLSTNGEITGIPTGIGLPATFTVNAIIT